MTKQLGMSQAELDQIELRLVGCDHRPWRMSSETARDTNGRRFVSKGSGKAIKKVIREARMFTGKPDPELLRGGVDPNDTPSGWDANKFVTTMALFTLTPNSTEDMANFVAHAPEDMEKLLNEVKWLRKRYRDCEVGRDEFKKEALSARVEKAKLQEKLTEMRRTVRDFGVLLRECMP